MTGPDFVRFRPLPEELMLSPRVELRTDRGVLYAEFKDCLRLDPVPVKDLHERYKEVVEGADRPDLIIDFSGLTFAGSASLGSLVILQRTCRKHGGRVILCNLEPTVFEAFKISRLESLFQFVDSTEGAFNTLKA